MQTMGEAGEMWLPERGTGGPERVCRGRVPGEPRGLRGEAVRGAPAATPGFGVQGRARGRTQQCHCALRPGICFEGIKGLS